MMSEDHEIIYLACPYTHPDPKVRQQRFDLATQAAAKLISQNLFVFSPITMTHPIDIVMAGEEETIGSDYWVKFDEAFMSFCSKIVVLKIEGWNESKGVAREIEYFSQKGRPVEYLGI